METASTESGGNKAKWITDMFTSLNNNFGQIQGITWFNINKETDWRIESSLASKQAFIAGATNKPVSAIINPTSTSSASANNPSNKTNAAKSSANSPTDNSITALVKDKTLTEPVPVKAVVMASNNLNPNVNSLINKSNLKKTSTLRLYLYLYFIILMSIFFLQKINKYQKTHPMLSKGHPIAEQKKVVNKRHFDSLSKQKN